LFSYPDPVLFIAAPPFSEAPGFLSLEVAELGPVDFPVSTACATAPAKGNANKPAARSIEREIVIAGSFPRLQDAAGGLLIVAAGMAAVVVRLRRRR
jgi:hypothetical protein